MTAAALRLEALVHAFEHVESVSQAIEGGAAAHQAVVASWRRSMLVHRLDPGYPRNLGTLTHAELLEARGRIEPLIHVARPSLDHLYKTVGGVGCCVLLADASGVPLDRRGAAADDKQFYEWGLWVGAVWSEDREGTNGIGTCIVDKRPVTIHKNQHFHSKNIDLSCIGAPIFDNRGQLIAVLDVSSCRSDLTPEFARIIAAATIETARRIEADFFRMTFPKARMVLPEGRGEPGDTGSKGFGAALLAVDSDDLVVGATWRARRMLGLDDAQLHAPLPLAKLMGQQVDLAADYANAERRSIQLALAEAGGNVSRAAISMGISRATLHRKLRRLGLTH